MSMWPQKTSTKLIHLALLYTLNVFAVACPSMAATVPSGTRVELRLLTPVSTKQPAGTLVRAIVIVPATADSSIVIGVGTVVEGATADLVQPQGDDQATLRIVWRSLSDDSGHTMPVELKTVAIDNARETVDSSGLIVGIRPSQTLEARLDKDINKLGSEVGGLLESLKERMVKPVDASIEFPAGVELTAEFTRPIQWDGSIRDCPVRPLKMTHELRALVDREPSRAMATKPRKPSDVANVMFIATEEQIRTAFEKAGWSTADHLSRHSKAESVRAVIEDRGYQAAPVSMLLLDGLPPDLVFQKQNDTFAKRHHIRIWKRPATYHGKSVWMAACTHDVGISFSEAGHTFTHKVDSNIDLERSKVVSDLSFTGWVRASALAPRAALPPDLANATGDKLNTDGKIAILEF